MSASVLFPGSGSVFWGYFCSSIASCKVLRMSMDLHHKSTILIDWLVDWFPPPPPPSTTQSCQASVRMEELLLRSQKDPMTSRLAALLHQRQSLLRDHLSTNLGRSTLFASITSSLEKDWQVSSSRPPHPHLSWTWFPSQKGIQPGFFRLLWVLNHRMLLEPLHLKTGVKTHLFKTYFCVQIVSSSSSSKF